LFTAVIAFRRLKSVSLRFIVAALVSANLLFLGLINMIPSSYFLGALWLWTVQLALLLVIAERYGISFRVPDQRNTRRVLAVLSLMLVAVVAASSYQAAFGGKYAYAVRAEIPWWTETTGERIIP
ncbi:MAG: hypothetical protein R8K20_00425, partial [Gallionellaceae bacterium]